MRGAPDRQGEEGLMSGIIPAYAGSTDIGAAVSRLLGDHPRICGEHTDIALSQTLFSGSSPHMRGALMSHLEIVESVGIIPAYAGSTGCISRHQWGVRDHPRICGEHPASSRPKYQKPGSSPHMRGAHRYRLVRIGASRIIPAYAGSTLVFLGSSA